MLGERCIYSNKGFAFCLYYFFWIFAGTHFCSPVGIHIYFISAGWSWVAVWCSHSNPAVWLMTVLLLNGMGRLTAGETRKQGSKNMMWERRENMLLHLRHNLIILVNLFTKFVLHVNEGYLPDKSDKFSSCASYFVTKSLTLWIKTFLNGGPMNSHAIISYL